MRRSAETPQNHSPPAPEVRQIIAHGASRGIKAPDAQAPAGRQNFRIHDFYRPSGACVAFPPTHSFLAAAPQLDQLALCRDAGTGKGAFGRGFEDNWVGQGWTAEIFCGHKTALANLDCGGKRSATPLWGRRWNFRTRHALRKRRRRCRSAGAVHDAPRRSW